MNKIDILDCTIRDGSYVVDGNWTQEEVKNITQGLSDNNISYIEVGNGVGLGAQRCGVISKCTDKQFIQTAASVKGNSKIGMFFIPGIGELSDIKLLREEGGDFLRIGTDATKSCLSFKYIEYAKSLGLEVSYNFMKSYVISPYEICKRSVEIEKYGTDTISLVDSAGGMLPEEVGKYIKLMKETLITNVGFHGHNNLLLANANNIAAIENGADVVDTTLMGIGRGAGNAQTESMIMILLKMGYHLKSDPLKISNISKSYIQKKVNSFKGSDELQLILGYAQFHDAYMSEIFEFSTRYRIDYKSLILEVSKHEKEKPNRKLIKKVAIGISKGETIEIFYPKFYNREFKNE